MVVTGDRLPPPPCVLLLDTVERIPLPLFSLWTSLHRLKGETLPPRHRRQERGLLSVSLEEVRRSLRGPPRRFADERADLKPFRPSRWSRSLPSLPPTARALRLFLAFRLSRRWREAPL